MLDLRVVIELLIEWSNHLLETSRTPVGLVRPRDTYIQSAKEEELSMCLIDEICAYGALFGSSEEKVELDEDVLETVY